MCVYLSGYQRGKRVNFTLELKLKLLLHQVPSKGINLSLLELPDRG